METLPPPVGGGWALAPAIPSIVVCGEPVIQASLGSLNTSASDDSHEDPSFRFSGVKCQRRCVLVVVEWLLGVERPGWIPHSQMRLGTTKLADSYVRSVTSIFCLGFCRRD